ncbi:MAG: LamG domain-containing protein, partial [Sedimentisphaerales bacterium]
MCRKQMVVCFLILLVSLTLTSVVNAAWPGLVAHWRLDEGTGSTAGDASGNGHTGTLNGGATWVAGKLDGGVYLDGVDDYIEIPNVLSETGTLAFWFKPDWDGSDPEDYRLFDASLGGIYFFISKGANHADINPEDFGFYLEDGTDADYQGIEIDPAGVITANTWFHLAVTWEFSGGPAILYLDGEEIARADTLGPFPALNPNPRFGLQTVDYIPSAHGAMSAIDDIMIFDKVLLPAEIPVIMQGLGNFPYAWDPSPLDGAIVSETWVSLGWSAGDFAVSHDVYLGDDYDSVNNATNESETFRINQVGTFYVVGFPGYPYPDGLVPGTTYYWRIDEVNEANPDGPWKGSIWSFSIPPKTAYNPNPPDGTQLADANAPTLTWTPGFGAKLHTVYLGNDYDQISDATGGSPQGLATYQPGPLELEKVYYWRVDEFDAVSTYKGDVWTFTTPGAVGAPQPALGATDVSMTTSLSWTGATNATSHQVYLGLDEDAVRNADTSSPEYQGSAALGSESIDPGKLAWHTTYYWRVDAVTSAGPIEGPIWSFTTADFVVVDNFESYTDDDGASEAIWQSWVDGFGVADNGAQVGYLLPPYAEQTIVHGGVQSMPLLY